MYKNKSSITKNLKIGFCVLIFIFSFFGLFSLYNIYKVSNLTRTIYNHPLVVSNAAIHSTVSITKMHRNMKDVVLFHASERIEEALAAVNEQEEQVYKYLDIVKERILGSEGRALEKEARELFDAWRPIRKEVIGLVNSNQKEKAAHITIGKGAKHVRLLEAKMLGLTKYARTKASNFMLEADNVHLKVNIALIVCLILSILVFLLVTIFTVIRVDRSERALQESEERYRSLVENQVELVSRFRKDGTMLYVNSGYCKYFGKVKEELMGQKWQPVVHPDDVKMIEDHLSRLNPKHPIVTFENRVLDAKGNLRWVQFSNRAFFDDKGRIIEIQSVGRDIHESKLLEQDLSDSEELHRTTIGSISDTVVITDDNGDFTYICPNTSVIFGMTSEEVGTLENISSLLGTNFFDLEELKRNKEIHNIELNVFDIHEKKHTILVNVKRVSIKNGTILYTCRDISEWKKSKEQNIKLLEQLHQSQKMEAIGTLAGGIAHDFNNMLGVIVGNTSYALNNVDKNDELYDVLLDVQESSKQAQKLTHQLLTFSKGGAPIKKVLNINKLINESAIFSTRGSKANCRFELSDDLWLTDVDEGQINQVIGNLIINANQSMPNGGTITIRTENTKIEADSGIPLSTGRYIKIVVEDQGIGISKLNLPNIFEPYYTTKQKGSGLGLATAYSIIKRHGGHITVYSEIDKGTVFHIYLLASSEDIVETKDKEEIKHAGKGKILVMDDQSSILKMACRMLNKMGYEVATATDGTQAIEIYHEAYTSQNPFDLVILDLTVPGGMGGAKTIIELLKIDPKVRALVSSGYSNDPIMGNYEDYGFCGVIPKPYLQNQLSEVLNKIFG